MEGSSNKEVNGYKLWYSGSHTTRNGVGVILRACLKDKVVHVNRCSDRIISLTLVIEGETVNVISAYAPQVGATTKGYSGVHEGFEYGVRNEDGCSILDFATPRVFPGEACSSQHKFVAIDTLFKRVQRRRAISASDANSMWNILASIIKDASKDSLGVATGTSKTHTTHMESWWMCEEVQSKVAKKQARFIELLSCHERNQEKRFRAQKRIAKARQRRRRDIGEIYFIKDEAGRIVTDEEEFKQRWGEYFSSRFNTGEPEGHEGVVDQNTLPLIDYYSRISQTEVGNAVQKMGRNKAVGPDQIPIEAWRSLGAEGISWLTSLFNKIFTSAKMPEEWRLSDVIPIFKNKGDTSLIEKYRERQRDVHLAFIDLEKAYDSVPRDLIWKTLIDKGESRRYIKVIRDMYNGAKTRLSRGIQEDILWCMIFADDIVLVSESTEGLNDKLENWREALEANGLRILQPKESFRYLRSMLHKSGRIDEDVAHRIKAAWLKPAMLYGSECWPITKSLANRMEVAELRMLRWTCGKTMLDMIPNGVYRAELEVETIIYKMREGQLRWFGHVRRRPQSAPVRRVEALIVDGMRRMGRPKLRWEDRVKLDMKELLLSEDMTSDRNEWRARTSLGG
ncbi:hypothetical protein Tco_0611825 [Tanacetum coccineum]